MIDLYRGEIRVQRNYFYLLLYVSFFPQLIAGPIVRYETVEQEILERHESIDDVAAGLRRFILGLAKKVILANNIARIAETIYAGDSAVYGTALYWLAAVAYALQIYFDFSGYSDMAIGLGRMFGFHFLENFDHPYTALPSRISGGGGTSLCRHGSATMSTSRSAATASKNPAGSGTFWSSGR